MTTILGEVLPSANLRSLQFMPTKLAGCYLVNFPAFHDSRGSFVKVIQKSAFEAQGLEADFAEVFYTTSNENVLRGMHFQVPPSDHAKLVYCTSGAIFDMALDLRAGSPTFGRHECFDLSERENNAVYLPRGIAHGFYVREVPSVVVYHVTSEHRSEHDQGIRWDSFGASWPVTIPILSSRDAAFPTLDQFRSPFHYDPPSANGHAGSKGR